MFETLRREFVYVWYYFDIQLRQIFVYWILGMLIGSLVSVFAKDKIHKLFASMRDMKLGMAGIFVASVLGILSPLCMYGTIPIAASFYKRGMREDWLAAFMMSSILLNPQLLMYSMALGTVMVTVRLLSCYVCGIMAGLLVYFNYTENSFFDFTGFAPQESHDTDPNLFMRFLKNFGRNIKATGIYFLVGVLLSALFQRYVPSGQFAGLFGTHKGFGVLLAATIGVPLYACGGGTIPLLQEWLVSGMSMGSAAAFMITGPATKITNMGALKIVLGMKNFILYIIFVMGFSLISGLLVNFIL